MKKVNLLLLLLTWCFMNALNAQSTLSDFDNLMESVKRHYQANSLKQSAYSPLRRTADVQNHANTAFTDRVRKPDLSYSSASLKYYRIKNTKTGEYLNYSGSKDSKGKPTAAPLTTVTTPGEGSVFFLYREGVVLGDGYGLCNSVSSTKYTLTNLDTYEWEATGTNTKSFFVEISDDEDALYIYHSWTIGDESVKKYWRFDTESQTVKYGEDNVADDYAEWMFEPVLSTPIVTTENVSAWYVIRNSSTGKFLHFNKENQAVETVTAPDSCSLFLLKGESLENGINLYNYAAGTNIAQGLRVIETNGKKYFISNSGDITGNDIYCEIDGTVSVGAFGEKSEWEFERITNFKEVFGHQFDFMSEDEILNLQNKLLEMFASTKVQFYYYYSNYIALVYSIFQGWDGQMGLNKASELCQTRTIIEKFLTGEYETNNHKDIYIHNIGHVDSDSNVIKRNLCTNSTMLLTNNMDHLHTNAWQILLVGADQEKNPIIYNTVTKTYIGKPIEENGVVTVKMTPNIADAGTWKMSIDEAFILAGNKPSIDVSTTISSVEMDKYYLRLQSPNAVVIQLEYFEKQDDAIKTPGCLWEFTLADSYINEAFYLHAADAINMFTDVIQTDMGLVQNGCNQYYCNFPSDYENSSLCNLTDKKLSSVFRTDGGSSNEKRYLIADMGEGTPVSGFYFYMKPNLQTLEGIPASVTVEGSNSLEGEYTVLASNIDLSMLMANMYYMSSLINQGGEAYRYLRFTVNGIQGFEDMLDFTLSEFYIFPHNDYTSLAKELLDTFYANDYMGEAIISPAVELVKLKATYLLDENVNNHSVTPQIGQYPTATYNALAECLANIQANNAETANLLLTALEDFINSIVNPIIVFESAWEDGYTNGTAITFKNYEFSLDAANIWDINQWVTLNNTGGNGYSIDPFTIDGEIPYNFQMESIPGWENLYDSHREAKNISTTAEGYTLYLTIDGEEDELHLNLLTGPATTTENKNRAWYLTIVGDNASIENNFSEGFINALASFGATFKQALIYEEGYKSGIYTYDENGGLAKSGFNDLLNFMTPYYQMGPIGIVKMYQSGELDDSMISYVVSNVEMLKEYFPYFVLNVSTAGYYYRLRGGESGNYLMSDITADGALAMGTVSSTTDESAVKSIFYTATGRDEGSVNVMAFDNGRYIKAEDGIMQYDILPLDNNSYASQSVYVNGSLTGTAKRYSIAMIGESQSSYLHDGGTVATPAASANNPALDWEIELVESLPIAFTSAMMTSICVPVELQIPEGVTAYILTGKETSDGSHTHAVDNERYQPGASVFNIEQIRLGFIPAGMPVLLKAAEGTYHFTINYSESDKSDAELERIEALNELNQLEGTHDARLISERDGITHHILSKNNGRAGMYKVNMVSAYDRGLDYVTTPTFKNTAHRAWLPYSSDMSPTGYSLAVKDRNDETTEIKDIEESATSEDNIIYDLYGRRIKNIVSPGIYIVNNKKVIVK